MILLIIILKILIINFDLKTLLLELSHTDEMRNINGAIMSYIGKHDKMFLSGSADLFSSTKTNLKDLEYFNGSNYGQNIAFGVREHAMAGIANGLSLSGFKISVSTFLSFSDYLKPSLRLSAIMHLTVTYIFSHDSITIGSDGPTHQPIEQLAMLRSTPNLNVFRPADINELIGVWEFIYENKNSPSALIITKEKVSKLETTSSE
jgi:transketolase